MAASITDLAEPRSSRQMNHTTGGAHPTATKALRCRWPRAFSEIARDRSAMGANPAVGACGTWVATVGDGDPSVWRYPEGAEAIRCRLLFKSAFDHPSVCMRREIFACHGLQFDGAYGTPRTTNCGVGPANFSRSQTSDRFCSVIVSTPQVSASSTATHRRRPRESSAGNS